MVLSTFSIPNSQADNLVPYRLQEHVAQVLSLLKMQLMYLNEETTNRELAPEMSSITELLSRCIHTLRDLHVLEAPGAFHENWVDQLRAALMSLRRPDTCQITMQVSGRAIPVNHQQAVIIYRILLTAASHMIILCRAGKPTLDLTFSDNGLSASYSDIAHAHKAPAWMLQSMEFLKHQAAIIDAELSWSFSGKEKGNKIILKLALG